MQILDDIRAKLNVSSGSAVSAELLMRLVAERHKPVQDKLKLIVPKRENNKNYWDCSLQYLEEAILSIFSGKIEQFEVEIIETFRPLRNKLLHGEFVSLMRNVEISPTGREILPKNGRTILAYKEGVKEEDQKKKYSYENPIRESILSMDRNGGFEEACRQAEEVIAILTRIYELPTA